MKKLPHYRLLLVEDNLRDARLVQIALSEAYTFSYELTTVPNVEEALPRLRKGAFDVALLDLGLPGSQGLETLLEFQMAAPELPVVVLTGLADEETALEAARRGAQDYLVKGRITGDLLVRVLRYAVERHRILMELRRALRATVPSEAPVPRRR